MNGFKALGALLPHHRADISEEGVYTRGDIHRTMLKTALTMLPATLAMSGYNIADSYFVGQLQDAGAMAAMSNTGPIVMLVGCIFMGVGTGIMANLSHALGRKDAVGARHLVSAGLLLAVLVSLVLCVGGLLGGSHLFRWMGAQGETLTKTQQYMNIWFIGCVTSVLSMEGNTLLITAGLPHLSSAMSMTAMIINAVLDPVMIFGWGPIPAMGIIGAAVATVASQAISAIVNLTLLHRCGLLSFAPIPLGEIVRLWRVIVRYAIPAALGNLLMPIGMYITQRLTYDLSHLVGYGDDLIAGIGMASRLEMVAFVFPMSLGRALMPMIGQNYGARLYSRVRSCFYFSTAVAQGILLVTAVILCLGFRHLAPWLAPGQPRVQEVMTLFMTIVPFGFGCTESMRFAGFALTGCGHPRMDAILKSLRVLALQLPLSWLALQMESINMVMVARLLTDIGSFTIAFLLALRCVRSLPQDGDEIKESA